MLPFLAFAVAMRPYTLPAQIGASIQVTLTEGTNMAIALSPDKKTIAMDLQGTIWTLPVAGGKARAITDALSDNRQPVWSPDGKQIAFQSYRSGDYHIWSIFKDGTGLRQLTSGVFDDREPFWSPDGKSVLFSSDRSGNYDIWKVEPATGKLTQVTTHPGNDYFPACSADGKQIVFISERKEGRGVYSKTLDDRERLLYSGTARIAAPVLAPSGEVLFNEMTAGQSLLKMGSGTSSLVISDSSEDVFPFRPCWFGEEEVVYTSDGQIKRRDIGTGRASVIPFMATVSLSRNTYRHKAYDFTSSAAQQVKGIRSPRVSPDGTQIVFTALSDLWLLKKGTAQPVRLTNDPYIEIDPAWSPDGKQLAFTSDRNGNMDIWIRDLNTGKNRCLVDQPEVVKYPAWSPDGKKLAYYQFGPSGRGQSDLVVIEFATNETTTLLKELVDAGSPSWSPDSKYLVMSAEQAYSSRFREGINKFLVLPVNGEPSYSSAVPYSSLATRGVNGPAWSPDGTKMTYVANGVLWIVTVNSAGKILGKPKQLTSEIAEAPSWTGDSRSIVFLASDQFKQVFLNDGHVDSIAMDLTWKYQVPANRIIIHAGKLFNGVDSFYHKDVDIVIEGGRIREITPHLAARNENIIDASGKTVMPGLFEMHTHMNDGSGEQSGRLWLSYGITSIREPGTDPYDALERREAWASGARTGPRTFIAGGHLEGNRIYYNRNVANQTAGAVELELKRSVQLGFDMIKTYVRMPDQVQKRIVDYAHAHGIPVSSHEIYPAVSYGIDGIEHMGASSRRGYSPKLSALNHSYQDVLALIIASKVALTPTASLHGGLSIQAYRDSAFFNHPQFASFYSPRIKAGLKAGAEQAFKSNPAYLNQYKSIQVTIKKVIEGGGRVLTGTDSPIIPPGLSLMAELQSWVAGGITPFETLRAATLWSAEAAGAGKLLGSLKAGKLADLVIINGDPLNNIKDVLNVETVFRNGVRYDIDDLLNPEFRGNKMGTRLQSY